jgi:NDP-sugar pyrophosphorylase family protein
MKAVILAGGRGTRLKPYTTIFPKPLMPVGDKPILEIIIRQLKAQNFDEIIMATGYQAELIMNFFGDGSKYKLKIKYYKEEKPLGTAGALALMKDDLKETFLLMNGDILTDINYSDLLEYHHKNKSIATIALKRRDVYVDFGVVDVDENGYIKGYTEKPTLGYLVSMGICVFEPEVLKYIEPNRKLDFPNLIKKLIAQGERVKGYIYDGYWLDIGRPDDYEKAVSDVNKLEIGE